MNYKSSPNLMFVNVNKTEKSLNFLFKHPVKNLSNLSVNFHVFEVLIYQIYDQSS